MPGKLDEILRSRTPPGAIVRKVETFRSHVDGSIIRTTRDLRDHNERNRVVDVREYDGHFCDPDAKKRREEEILGVSKQDKLERVEALKEAAHKVEQGYKPEIRRMDDAS
jgi:hypothetical protein